MNQKLFDLARQFTDVSDKALKDMLAHIPVKTFKKGTVLIEQGQNLRYCYFVLEGCLRQYSIDEEGNEATYQFYTELENATIFGEVSEYYLECLEDSVCVEGDMHAEMDMYEEYAELGRITRSMMQTDLSKIHTNFSNFVASSPAERYQRLMKERPGLINRVPQHQLASYLGITPESLSRIKKRTKHP